MNTTENNKIIVEFMKWDILNDMTYSKATKGKWVELDKLKFHSNWNWLMEVVEKIESLTDINSNGCFMVLESIGFNAKFIFDDGTRILKDSKGETKIEAVYMAVVAFIEWYNKNAVKN